MEKMEAVRTNGSTTATKTSSSTRLNRPGLLLSKEIKPLKIVESRDVANKIQDEDPYKELELYLAKVNVSTFFFLFLSSVIHSYTWSSVVRSLLVEMIFQKISLIVRKKKLFDLPIIRSSFFGRKKKDYWPRVSWPDVTFTVLELIFFKIVLKLKLFEIKIK